MTATKKEAPYQIIRHRGTPTRGQLPNGVWVYAEEKIWIPEWGRFIPVAPYSDHFVYTVPEKYKGSSMRCSCGSAAVISGYSSYKDMASQQGLLVVCLAHSNTGVHIKGGSRWI